MIKPLTSLRFIFPLFVFLSHLSFLEKNQFYKHLYINVFSEGFLGVIFFFILSGFILAYNYQDKILNKSVPLKTFFVARIARIYPVHILTLLMSLPFNMIKSFKLAILFLINTFLLQSYFENPNTYFSFNAPSWSISDELFFYLLFPFLILYIIAKPKIYRFVFILFFVFVVLYLNFFLNAGNKKYWLYISPFVRIFDFFVGILLFNLFEKVKKRFESIRYNNFMEFLALAIFLFFFSFHSYINIEFRYSIYYWFPMSLIIIVFALSKRLDGSNGGFFSRILSKNFFVYAGEISFCFYMTHYLMISYCGSVFKHFFPMAGGDSLKVLFIIIATLTVSITAFELIEKPFNKKIKNYFI